MAAQTERVAIAPMRFRLRLRKRPRPQVRKAAKKMLAARRIRRRPLLPGEGKSSAEPPEFIPAGMSSHAFAEQAQRIADALAEDAIPLDTSRVNAKLVGVRHHQHRVRHRVRFGRGVHHPTPLQHGNRDRYRLGHDLRRACGVPVHPAHRGAHAAKAQCCACCSPCSWLRSCRCLCSKMWSHLLCNLLLLGSYVFLVMVSIAFELRGARERKASPLYFVGMSQTTLSAGLALGFALGLLPSATGALDHAMLSIISLGLVVLLAVFVAFTQGRMTADQAATDAEKIAQRIAAERMLEEKLRAEEHPSKGRWKSSCESVVEAGGPFGPRNRGVHAFGEGSRHRAHSEQAVHIGPYRENAHLQHLPQDGHRVARGAS